MHKKNKTGINGKLKLSLKSEDVPQRIQSCTNPRRMSNDEMFHNEYKAVLILDECRIRCSTTTKKIGCTNPRRMSNKMFHNKNNDWLY